jgi:hypothetical protein
MSVAAIAIGVATNVISSKILGGGKKQQEQVSIGGGTAPTLSPGPDAQISPIEGSQVQEFGEFTYDDPAKPAGQEDILTMLQSAGINPTDLDQFGIAGMAVGGALNAANGGELNLKELLAKLDEERGLFDLDAKELKEFKTSLFAKGPEKTGIMDLIPDIDFKETKDVALYDSTSPMPMQIDGDLMKETGLASLNATLNPTMTERYDSFMSGFSPETQELFADSITQVGTALGQRLASELLGDDEPARRVSIQRTQTLPTGGLGAKRDYLRNIRPIDGTAFAGSRGFKDGGVLDRPMFTPMLDGGDIEGPGGPKDDLIPVMASDGEFMLSNASVKHMGKGNHQKGIAMLEKFNKQGNRKYG